MKNYLIAAASLAVLLLGATSSADAAPTQPSEFKWLHFGADPAYSSRADAMTDRAAVFSKFGYNAADVSCLVAATAAPGTLVRLNVGDRLKHMESSHGVVHKNTVIAFQEAQHGIEYTAVAEEWTATCGDRTITVDLPQICNNWSDREPPPPPQEGCASMVIYVPPGPDRSVRYTTERHGPIKSFNCWGIIAGQYREGAPRNCDKCVWNADGLVVVRRYYHLSDDDASISFYHTSIFEVPDDATSGTADGYLKVTIVFPVAATKEGVSPCIEVNGQIYPAAVVLPPSWHHDRVEIPKDFWTNPRVINPNDSPQ